MMRRDVQLDPAFAPQALEALDSTVHFYVEGMRSVKRAVLCQDPLVEAQENDAEHSWHIPIATQTFWENRRELGIRFPRRFSIGRVVLDGLVHDTGEPYSADVDAMTTDPVKLANKAAEEMTGLDELEFRYPYLRWMARRARSYEPKRTPEARFNSDVDKLAAVRIIRLYSPERWWGYGGEPVSRARHDRVVRGKLLTPFGHVLFNEIAKDLDSDTKLFPANEMTCATRY